jgi:Flp pilus assembly protein TadB
MLCAGIFRYNGRNGRPASQPGILDKVAPVVALAGLALVLYGNVHPLPPAPLRYFIWVTAILIVIAIAIAYYLERTQPDRLERAGQLLAGADDMPLVQEGAWAPGPRTADRTETAGVEDSRDR